VKKPRTLHGGGGNDRGNGRDPWKALPEWPEPGPVAKMPQYEVSGLQDPY